MSMSLANADTYIARIVGGANNTAIKAQAREALQDAMEEFDLRHDWAWQRTDTSESFGVADCGYNDASTTVTTSNSFENVLVGMTVTGINIAADTTVASIASGTSLELSQNTAGAGAGTTLTFGGSIPIIASTDTYNLPTAFKKPLSCRLISAQTHPLEFVTQGQLDKTTFDQAVEGTVTHYTLYNAAIFDAGDGLQQGKIKFWRVPAADNTALLRYYRPFDATADPVDIDDQYLFTLLRQARVFLLELRNADDSRLPNLRGMAEKRLRSAIAKDVKEAGEDTFEGFISPMDARRHSRFSGVFYPRGDF